MGIVLYHNFTFTFILGLIETGAIIGPLIGLSLASFCANVYVDIESVNTGNSINLNNVYNTQNIIKYITFKFCLLDPQIESIFSGDQVERLRSLKNFSSISNQ